MYTIEYVEYYASAKNRKASIDIGSTYIELVFICFEWSSSCNANSCTFGHSVFLFFFYKLVISFS